MSKATALTRLAGDGAAPAGDGPAGAVLRRHVRQPRDAAAGRCSASRACATSTPAASAATCSSTTSATSCCCRCPTTTRTRTASGPTRRSRRSPRPTARSSAWRTRPAASTPSWTSTRVVIVADHSHALIERRIEFEAAFRDFHVLGPVGRRVRRGARSRCARRARSAQIYVLVPEGRDALRAAPGDRGAGARGRRARAVRRRRRGRAARRRRAASCASRRAAMCATRAAARWSRRGRPRRRWTRRVEDGLLVTPGPSGCAGPLLGGAGVPDLGRRLPERRAGLRVPRLGRGRPRRRRLARLAAPQRLARRAALLRRRSSAAPGVGHPGRRRRCARPPSG